MDIEKLNRANNLMAVINTAKRNIENYKKLGESKEIRIASNDKPTGSKPIFITGSRKFQIIELLIKEQEDFLEANLSEFEKL